MDHNTYTAVAEADDLRDSGSLDVEAVIRIRDEEGDEVDVVTYPPDEDEEVALESVRHALDAAGWYPVGRLTVEIDRIHGTVTRAPATVQ